MSSVDSSSRAPRQHHFTLATLNTRTLVNVSYDKLSNLAKQLSDRRVDVCCLQETYLHQAHVNHLPNFDFHFLESPPNDQHPYGLGFAVSSKLQQLESSTKVFSHRIARLTIHLPTTQARTAQIIHIINVYAPTSAYRSKHPQEYQQFSDLLATVTATSQAQNNAFVFVCGDFNGRLGKLRLDAETLHIGSHAKGTRNDNGSSLAEYLIQHDLLATNTCFQLPSRHITTWTGSKVNPNGTQNRLPVYSQIDFILCPAKLRQTLSSARSYMSTAESDHKLVVAEFHLAPHLIWRSHSSTNREPSQVQPLTDRLRSEPLLRIAYNSALSQAVQSLPATFASSSSPPQMSLDLLNDAICTTAHQVLGSASRPQRSLSPSFINHPELQSLSLRKTFIRLQLFNPNTPLPQRAVLQLQLLALRKQMKSKHKELFEAELDAIATEVERLPRSSVARFAAAKRLKCSAHSAVLVTDASGSTLCSTDSKITALTAYFQGQFNKPSTLSSPLLPFSGSPRPLTRPLLASEVVASLKSLNNGRAPGCDGIKGELLKYAPGALAAPIAAIINRVFEQHSPIAVGQGLLIPIPKPGKPRGPCANLRPITVLSSFRKVLSHIILQRVYSKAISFIPESQSAFRHGRATTDIVAAYRWLIAKCVRYKTALEILGTDLSRAFDTISREKLLVVLAGILDEDELRLVRFLLADTSLQIKLQSVLGPSFPSTIGSAQGDCLSPLLFIIYLEASLRRIRIRVQHLRPACDADLPSDTEYADDCDWLSRNSSFIDNTVRPLLPSLLAEDDLVVNEQKTERYSVAYIPPPRPSAFVLVNHAGGHVVLDCKRPQLALQASSRPSHAPSSRSDHAHTLQIRAVDKKAFLQVNEQSSAISQRHLLPSLSTITQFPCPFKLSQADRDSPLVLVQHPSTALRSVYFSVSRSPHQTPPSPPAISACPVPPPSTSCPPYNFRHLRKYPQPAAAHSGRSAHAPGPLLGPATASCSHPSVPAAVIADQFCLFLLQDHLDRSCVALRPNLNLLPHQPLQHFLHPSGAVVLSTNDSVAYTSESPSSSCVVQLASTAPSAVQVPSSSFDAIHQPANHWQNIRKLGSLLGDAADAAQRRSCAVNAMRQYTSLWRRDKLVKEHTRIRLYNCFVWPVLTYNFGALGLPASEWALMDSFHRRQLRLVLGIHWPNTISNSKIYKRCNVLPLSIEACRARWSLFGHHLRLPPSTPVHRAIVSYFDTEGLHGSCGKPKTTLPVALNQDLQLEGHHLPYNSLKDREDLRFFQSAAADVCQWQELVNRVVAAYTKHHPLFDSL